MVVVVTRSSSGPARKNVCACRHGHYLPLFAMGTLSLSMTAGVTYSFNTMRMSECVSVSVSSAVRVV